MPERTEEEMEVRRIARRKEKQERREKKKAQGSPSCWC
jgi:hypothetical protein